MRAKLTENINKVFKPKSSDEISKSMYKGPGFYLLALEFTTRYSGDSYLLQFLNISNENQLQEYLEKYTTNFKDSTYLMNLFKVDPTNNSRIDIYRNSLEVEANERGSQAESLGFNNIGLQTIFNKLEKKWKKLSVSISH